MDEDPLVDRIFPPWRPWWRPLVMAGIWLVAGLSLVLRTGRHVRSYTWFVAALLGALALPDIAGALRSRPRDDSWRPEARWDGDRTARNEWASSSLALGVVGWFLGGTYGAAPVAAIASGLVALRQIARGDGQGKGLAIAGTVLGVVGLVTAVLSFGNPGKYRVFT